MRKGLLVAIVMLSVLLPVSAEGESPITAGIYADAGSAEMLWSSRLYLKGGVTIRLNDMFSLNIPATYMSEQYGFSLFDTSMVLRWRPSPLDFWFGISLFQGISIHGQGRPVNWYHHMSEIQTGYTLYLTDWLFVEPMIIVRDPGSMFSESLDIVSEYVEGFSRLRFCLNLGVIGLPLGRRDEPRQ